MKQKTNFNFLKMNHSRREKFKIQKHPLKGVYFLNFNFTAKAQPLTPFF